MWPSWAVLGYLGAILKRSCGHLGSSWSYVGPSWGHLGPLGAILGQSWAVLEQSWAILGLSWGHLGHVGAVLGQSWAVLGPFRAILGPPWSLLGAILSCLGAILRASWAGWGHLGVKMQSKSKTSNFPWFFIGFSRFWRGAARGKRRRRRKE